MGPGNHVLDGVPDHRMGRNNFEAEGDSHCKVKGHSAVICAKTVDLFEMPFGLWAQMGPRIYVFRDSGPDPRMGRGNFGEGEPVVKYLP